MPTRTPRTSPAPSRVITTALGPMRIAMDEHDQLARATFCTESPDAAPGQHSDSLALLLSQLDEFAAGTRHAFELPLAPKGTDFERLVWAAACAIPRGHTTTYARLAATLGRPSAARAVGGALARNPWHVIVPCHRVVGRDGALTGYAGGIDTKQRLLELERATR